MNYRNKLIKISLPLINELKKLPEIKAIAYYGSLSGNYADKYSDVDIVCFCTKVPSLKVRRKIHRKLNSVRWRGIPIDFDALTLKNTEFTVAYKIIDDFNYYFENFNKEKAWFEQELEINVYRTKTIYDPEKILFGFKNKMRKYPLWLKKNLFERIAGARGRLEVVPKSIERNNWIGVEFALNWTLDGLLHAIYALNNTYYSIPKWFSEDCKKFKTMPKNFKKRLDEISKLNNKEDLIKKIQIINELITETEKLAKKQIKFPSRRGKAHTEKVIRETEKLLSVIK